MSTSIVSRLKFNILDPSNVFEQSSTPSFFNGRLNKNKIIISKDLNTGSINSELRHSYSPLCIVKCGSRGSGMRLGSEL